MLVALALTVALLVSRWLDATHPTATLTCSRHVPRGFAAWQRDHGAAAAAVAAAAGGAAAPPAESALSPWRTAEWEREDNDCELTVTRRGRQRRMSFEIDALLLRVTPVGTVFSRERGGWPIVFGVAFPPGRRCELYALAAGRIR